MGIRYLIVFLFTLIVNQLHAAPAIEIVRFNNTATYYAGGSISIHINPKGVFQLNNSFTLELSDASGSFSIPVVLGTVSEFFTPIINGIIPASTPQGTGYKLRVKATTGPTISAETNAFTIASAPSTALQTPEIVLIGSSAKINCLSSSDNNPMVGWLTQTITDKTPTPERSLDIKNFNAAESYTVTIVDLFSATSTSLYNQPVSSTGRFTFPSDKRTGYYTIEVERKFGNVSTIRSFTYLFNTGNTNLGNSSSETICVGKDVTFNIDIDNIKYNYPNSKYIINYGDGSNSETYTHAQILEKPSLLHVFNKPTCSNTSAAVINNSRTYKIEINLLNKGILKCTDFDTNGFGTTKYANASTPPEADFEAPLYICENSKLDVTNTTKVGQYGTGTTCETGMYTTWSVKKPGSQYVIYKQGEGKLNLSIPASEINVAGCWSIKLEVNNLDGCQTISTKEKTVGVEPTPEAKFKITKAGVEVTTICNDETVDLTDQSNLIGLNCQNPTYTWSISPTNGFSFVDNTTSSSQNPKIKFTTAGTYDITQTIKNSCGTYSIKKTLIVNGAPTLTLPTVTSPICKASPADTILDFSLSGLKPTYSTGAYAPKSYKWEVNGSSTPNADWEFAGGTTASSDFPKIRLKAYRSYSIKITLDGGCGNSSATYSIELRQTPTFSNTSFEQNVCSGGSSSDFNLNTDMSNTTYSWTTAISPANGIIGLTTETSGTKIPGSTLTINNTSSATATFSVKATNNGCSVTKDFKVNVFTKPSNPTTQAKNVCLGDAAESLTATFASGNALLWYTSATGGTGSSTAPKTETSATGSKTYYVTQATNSTPVCESDRSTLTVTVYPIPSITAAASNSSNCLSPNGSITISGLVASSSYEVSYKLNNGSPVKATYSTGAATSITISNLASGEYTDIKVTLNGCTSNVVGPLTISNPSSPTGNKASSNGPICSGTTLNLSGSSETANATYSWTGPNGFTSTLQNPSISSATTNANGTYKLTASINGCAAAAVSVDVIVKQTPAAPTVTSPVNLCQDATSSSLSATAGTGYTLLWYDAATGGTSSTTAPKPATNNVGTTSYFVSQTTDNTTITCEGPRAEIKVIVKATPKIKAEYKDPTNCPTPDGTILISDLISDTDYKVQYTNPAGSIISINAKSTPARTITIANLSAGEYKNISVTLDGCPSNVEGPFTLKNPSSPTGNKASSNGPICSGTTLNLSGSSETANATYSWTGPNGFTSTLQNPSISSATTNANGTYKLTASINGCAAAAVSVDVIVKQTPAAPTVTSPVNLCQDATSSALSATAGTGYTLLWYDAATGGTSSTTAPKPATNNVGTTSYFVSQTTDNTSITCEGPRAEIKVIVKATPKITADSTNPTNCITPDGTIVIKGLTKSTAYTVQYTNPAGNKISSNATASDNATITIGNLSAGEYSDISVTLDGCPSNKVGPFKLTNPTSPTGNKASSNGPICSGNTLTLTGSSETANASYSWTGPNGFASNLQNPSIPKATDAASGTYNLTVSVNGCGAVSVSAAAIVRKTPDAPVATSPVNLCQGTTPTALSATAGLGYTLIWYDAAGVKQTGAPVPSSGSTGTTSYFVSQTTDNTPIACEGPKTEIKVIVKTTPKISATSTNPTNCPDPDGKIIISGLGNSLVYTVQYINASGTNVSTTSTSSSEGNIAINKLPAGEYKNISVTLDGCPSNVVGPFTLTNPTAPANVAITSNAPVCTGQNVTLSASSSTPGATFTWTGPAFQGQVSGASQSITNATVVASGVYSVVATLVGCNSEPATANIVVYQTPAPPTTISPLSYCQNDVAVALRATGDAGNTFTWYTQASGGTGLPSIVPATTTLGSTTYYVEQSTPTNPPCVSPRTPLIVNIYEIPSITGEYTNPTNCIKPDGTITIKGVLVNTQYTVAYTFDGVLRSSLITSDKDGIIKLIALPAGTYADITVKLNGCTSNVLKYVLTNPASPSNTTISSNAPICSGETLTLEASSTTLDAVFSWTGPAFPTPTAGAKHTFNKTPASYNGTYTVIASIYGCPAPPVTKNIVVHPTPAAPASQSLVDYCQYETSSELTATITGNNSLIWYSPTNYTASTIAPKPSTAVVGSTFYYVTQISPTVPACESERTRIEVKIKPIPQIAVSADAPTTCNSNNGVMTLTGLFPNTNYQLNYIVNKVLVNTNVNTDVSGKIVINNLVGGIYKTIFVTLNGCKSNVVEGPFNLVNPDVPATPVGSSNSPICEGSTLKLTATSLTPNATYFWTGPSSFTSSARNPEILNAAITRKGQYKVVAQANGCTSDTGYVDVIIHPNPIVNLGPDLQLLPPSQQILNPAITNGPISQYTWTPVQNLSCSNCGTPTVTVLNTTLYKLVVKNVNGCIGSDDILITALCEKSLVYIPNAFIPDGGGSNSIFRIRSAGNLTVKHFRIFNKWGEMIFERNNFPINDASYGWDGRVNGKVVNPDVFVYTVEVQCENGSTFFYKGNVTLLR